MEECTIEANFNLSKEGSTESKDLNSCSHVKEYPRSCTECHTTRTPLWRGGPAGPRSLCNACGIRNRKKRKALIDLIKEGSVRKKKSFISNNRSKFEAWSSKLGFMPIDRQVSEKGKLREEERAAIMLMALSCGSVFA